MQPKVCAVVAAAGSSARMGGEDKLAYRIGGNSVLERSLLLLQRNALVSEIVVATKYDKIKEIRALCERAGIAKLRAVVTGGANRFLSVQRAVAASSTDAAYYCIHDAARPFASDALVTGVIMAAFEHGAAAPCLMMKDTVKQVHGGYIVSTPNRNALRSVATPQVFEAKLYRAAAEGQTDAFDDCEIVEKYGKKVFVVEGEPGNIKITTPDDIARASSPEFRIGHGYDVHKFAENRKLILGGVEVAYAFGLLGHSDADVLAHAVADALLGAAALGDIGRHFPDSDERYKGADSIVLLREVARLVAGQGFAAVNIDATIVCQQPKLAGYIGAMRQKLAAAVGVDITAVNVKATTEEGLGFTGQKQGIAAHCVALLQRL